MTGNDFLLKLVENGYFKYTDPKDLQAVKDGLLLNLEADTGFMTEFNFDGPFQTTAMDRRFYNCGDGEELFEAGGVTDMLDRMAPLFTKIGVSISYSDDDYSNDKHTIKLNGRKYLLADYSPLGWGETIEKYAKMLNNELALHQSDERIYLYSHDSGEYMVVLTGKLFEIVSSYVHPDKSPLTVDAWIEKILSSRDN